jgi:hypothetical protein
MIKDEVKSSSTHQPMADESSELGFQHREYLIEKHGTTHLDPLPQMDDADPHNWPTWKVRIKAWSLCVL